MQALQLCSLANHNLQSVSREEGKPSPALIFGLLASRLRSLALSVPQSLTKKTTGKTKLSPAPATGRKWETSKKKVKVGKGGGGLPPPRPPPSHHICERRASCFDLFIKKWNALDGSGRRRWPYLIDVCFSPAPLSRLLSSPRSLCPQKLSQLRLING